MELARLECRGGREDGRTDSIAFLTRSDVMRPLLARFLISPAFEEPEDSQAMPSEL